MVILVTANNATSAAPVAAVRPSNPAPAPMLKPLKPRFYGLITSAPASAVSPASLASRAKPSPPGSKKVTTLPPLEATLLPARHPLLQEAVELDEVWSFVGQRSQQRWIWLALCRRTRQVLAYAIGPRDDVTCRLLWARIPAR